MMTTIQTCAWFLISRSKILSVLVKEISKSKSPMEAFKSVECLSRDLKGHKEHRVQEDQEDPGVTTEVLLGE